MKLVKILTFYCWLLAHWHISGNLSIFMWEWNKETKKDRKMKGGRKEAGWSEGVFVFAWASPQESFQGKRLLYTVDEPSSVVFTHSCTMWLSVTSSDLTATPAAAAAAHSTLILDQHWIFLHCMALFYPCEVQRCGGSLKDCAFCQCSWSSGPPAPSLFPTLLLSSETMST